MDAGIVCCIAAVGTAFALRSLTQPPLPDHDFEFTLAPPRNLNGLSIAELSAIRKDGFDRVRELRDQIPLNYQLNEGPVWSQVRAHAPWLSVLSLMHDDYSVIYTRDQISDAAFSLANPFLPASLHYRALGPYGLILDCSDDEKNGLRSRYPTWAAYDSITKTINLVYTHLGFQPGYSDRSCSTASMYEISARTNGPGFYLNLLNARDLGFKAFELDSRDSSGFDIEPTVIQKNEATCAYISPTNCNGLSGSGLHLGLEALPARLHINFFRHYAGADPHNPDLTEVIEVTNTNPSIQPDK